MNILICFGTRPEAIKIMPLIKEMSGKINYVTLFTGQHQNLVSLESDRKVSIVDGENRLDSIICSILNKNCLFDGISHVMIQGDTTSAFALAMAAYHRGIKVIHLEAGLRTYDKMNPYPEEFNRSSISKITDIHLCPTEYGRGNIIKEGCGGDIYVVGNTVLDNLVGMKTEYGNKVIVTMHRRENHTIIREWFEEIENLASENKDLRFIIPLHPNPAVKKHKDVFKNVEVVAPLPYDDFLKELCSCRFAISDSGGIQEEASFLRKKVIVCRKVTERPESVGTTSFLCGYPSDLRPLFYEVAKDYKTEASCPYGDGNSSKRIVEILSRI